MAEGKAAGRRAPDRPELRALLDRARAVTLTEEELREQKASFVYGNAPKDSEITRESARESVDRIRIGKGSGQGAGLAHPSREEPASSSSHGASRRRTVRRGSAGVSAPAAGFPASRVPVVNVASVPQRSPLRYPGGKTWLIPHIREWLRQTKPEVLIEPFAGGAIVSLTAVMEDLVRTAFMAEIDRDVAAFWRAALEPDAALQDRIRRFEPTLERLRELEHVPPATVAEHGFRTLVLNRTRRGGILAPGASFCRSGENGRGLLSRWYPETLVKRLDAIQESAQRLVFMEGDGLKALPILLRGWGRKAAVFLDPPYTAGGKRAGARLYAHSSIDHAGMFRLLAEHGSNFLMTYDAAPEIVSLVHEHHFDAVCLSMKNGHHNHLPELVITSERLFA